MSEESPPPAHGPDDPKPPLEYRNYSDDRPERRKNVWAFVIGFILGFVVIVLGIFILIIHALDTTPDVTNRSTRSSHHSPIDSFFACSAALAAVCGFAFLRGKRRRFMLAGFLLGVALACIIEGICAAG